GYSSAISDDHYVGRPAVLFNGWRREGGLKPPPVALDQPQHPLARWHHPVAAMPPRVQTHWRPIVTDIGPQGEPMTSRYQLAKTFRHDNREYTYFPFDRLREHHAIHKLPLSIRILLENLLRHAGEPFVSDTDIEAVAGWNPHREPDTEIAFVPARVILQDFTGVPAIVDLATLRDAMARLGGDPEKINPLSPAELVIDHSVMVDHFGSAEALERNTDLEVARNRERYQFLKWGQQAFNNLKVVPPGTGIVHQVNLEYLARGVFSRERDGQLLAYPDTLVGTDSHTTMINGLGVLGWGVGGIEAEAAMLGQPISMLLPQVVGFRLSGRMLEGATATDLVLTVTQ